MEYDRSDGQVNTLDVICERMGLIRGFWCGRFYVLDPKTGEVTLLAHLNQGCNYEKVVRKNGRWHCPQFP